MEEKICNRQQLAELFEKQPIISLPVVQASLSIKDCDFESVEPEESQVCLALLEPAFYLPSKVGGQSVN